MLYGLCESWLLVSHEALTWSFISCLVYESRQCRVYEQEDSLLMRCCLTQQQATTTTEQSSKHGTYREMLYLTTSIFIYTSFTFYFIEYMSLCRIRETSSRTAPSYGERADFIQPSELTARTLIPITERCLPERTHMQGSLCRASVILSWSSTWYPQGGTVMLCVNFCNPVTVSINYLRINGSLAASCLDVRYSLHQIGPLFNTNDIAPEWSCRIESSVVSGKYFTDP